jgi:branched-chain amino acid transport system ATP-binding protein
MLQVDGLVVRYGGVTAVDGMDLSVPGGVVHGLIGPNGAGKSTAVHAMSGGLVPTSGSVRLNGVELVGASPQRVLAAGLARTFQQAQLWTGMTVEQNLTVPLLRCGRKAARRRVDEVAELLHIVDVLPINAGELPFGTRRLVEVARAATTEPSVMLLDEPGAGLTPTEKRHLAGVLQRLAAGGTAVLLIDHDMQLVMSSCSLVTVLDVGRVIAEGPPDDIRTNRDVIDVYLGRTS